MNKNLKKLALAFALVAIPISGAFADSVDNNPADYSEPQVSGWNDADYGVSFDANKTSYDVDTRTGKCFATTFYRPNSVSRMMGMAEVSCDNNVLKLVPAKKRNIYNLKFGTPKH